MSFDSDEVPAEQPTEGATSSAQGFPIGLNDGDPGPPADADWDDPRRDNEREWLLLNSRVAVLTERSWFTHDPDAGTELAAIFDRWIFPLVRSAAYGFLGGHYEAYAKQLLTTAFEVARTAIIKGKDMPLAYVVTSLRHHHVNEMRAAQKRSFHEKELLETAERVAGNADNDPFRLAHERETDKLIRQLFHQWRVQYAAKRDKIGQMIVDVLELCYLTGETQSDAYNTLGLTPVERKRTAERLSRMRRDEGSMLHRLAAIVRADGRRPNDGRPKGGRTDER